MAKIFISHSSTDQQFAESLYNVLKMFGHDPWLDSWRIIVGQDIAQEVEKGIGNADFLLVVLTPTSVNSPWVEREWKAKYWQETQNNSIQVIPVMRMKCEVPLLLRARKYADFTNSESLLRELDLLMQCFSCDNVKLKVYEEHTSAQPELINIFRENKVIGDPKAYFFQYSAVEIRPVLRQAVMTGYRTEVFVQDPNTVPIERQKERIEVSLNAIRQIDSNFERVRVYQVSPPLTTKLVYVPNLFIALSYYNYLNAGEAPPPVNDPDNSPIQNGLAQGQYDVSGHDNPVILIRPGAEGWTYWSDFAIRLYNRYLACSQLIHPDSSNG